LPAAPAGGRALTNSMLNMVLINAARGYHAHLDRAAVVARVGAADFNAFVAAYTADFAVRPDVTAAYPLGHYVAYLVDWVQEALLHPHDAPVADRPGRSRVSFNSRVWTHHMQRATLHIHGHGQ
jgi:hypothetical protein